MNKKGFTLVELLAVIVILAIIALIATPIVLNVINEAQKGADARSVEAFAKAVETKYYSEKVLGRTTSLESAASNMVQGSDYNGDKIDNCSAADSTEKALKLTGCTVGGRGATYTYENGKATADE